LELEQYGINSSNDESQIKLNKKDGARVDRKYANVIGKMQVHKGKANFD
jgi:hypothetical protein